MGFWNSGGFLTGTDFDADGRTDRFFADNDDSPNGGRVLRVTGNLGAGSFRQRPVIVPPTPLPQLNFRLDASPPEITLPALGNGLAIADFNSDGRNEVIIALEAAGQASMALYAGRDDFSSTRRSMSTANSAPANW